MNPATPSQQLYHRALKHTPTGTHSNTRVRAPHPYYITEAHGAYVTDADGQRLLDFIMGNGAIILGHDDPHVRESVRRAVDRGATTGFESPDAVACVELLAELIPGLEAVRFANTGTEAVLHALRIARAATGRQRIAKAEASYHGWADTVWVSTWPPLDQAGPASAPAPVPGSAGLAHDAHPTLVLPFNDLAATTDLLKAHGPELAAVIVEPAMIDIGYVPATREYLTGLRELTARLGIVLIFDEMLTGFRLAPGGAREFYGVTPDLSTFGKAIANGYPLAAVEGRRDLLDLTDPARGGEVGWVGTFNGHAVVMAAARASLTQLRGGAVVRRLAELTGALQASVAELARDTGQAILVAGAGGHFQPYFTVGPPRDYREALTANAAGYRRFVAAAQERHAIIAQNPLGHCALSIAHTEANLTVLIEAIGAALSSASASTTA